MITITLMNESKKIHFLPEKVRSEKEQNAINEILRGMLGEDYETVMQKYEEQKMHF